MPLHAMQLQVGDDAPLFELPDADMRMFSLAKQRGRIVVLYFYPKDDTPGCTMEANEFSNLESDFEHLGALVVGVSQDDCISHASFRDKYGLTVQLLSDPEGKVCRKYGVLIEKDVDGERKRIIQRSTFIIDKRGKLRHVMYGVHAHGHAQEVLRLIQQMR